MFPLGSVLVPTALLPLQVFEPRYHRLLEDVLGGDGEFGVVLIERGSDVGGGDQRSDLGTVAGVLQTRRIDEHRRAVAAVGRRRLRVARWLEDDPYPRAIVTEPEDVDGPDDGDRRERAVRVLRRTLALAAELGATAPPATIEIADDPRTASYNLLAVAPLGPYDRQRLLDLDATAARLTATTTALEEVEEDLRTRLHLSDDDHEDDL